MYDAIDKQINIKLAQRVRQARIEAGLTQNEMARLIHVASNVTISRYESGKRSIGLDVLQRIARATGKNIWWFMLDEQQKNFNDYSNDQNLFERALLNLTRQLDAQEKQNLAEYMSFLRYKCRIKSDKKETKSQKNENTSLYVAEDSNDYF